MKLLNTMTDRGRVVDCEGRESAVEYKVEVWRNDRSLIEVVAHLTAIENEGLIDRNQLCTLVLSNGVELEIAFEDARRYSGAPFPFQVMKAPAGLFAAPGLRA